MRLSLGVQLEDTGFIEIQVFLIGAGYRRRYTGEME